MKKQQGFAHAILIIGMAVALLGALGFIFWQNFIYEEPGATKTEIVKNENNNAQDLSDKSPAIIVDTQDYSLEVVDGFKASPEQMYTYTGSLKSVETFVNNEGDYFELLVSQGGGGGYSADYFWNYKVSDSKPLVAKSDRCLQGGFACTAENGSVEGIISEKDKLVDYYFAFGNKSKDEINLAFVDAFISTFRFK